MRARWSAAGRHPPPHRLQNAPALTSSWERKPWVAHHANGVWGKPFTADQIPPEPVSAPRTLAENLTELLTSKPTWLKGLLSALVPILRNRVAVAWITHRLHAPCGHLQE